MGRTKKAETVFKNVAEDFAFHTFLWEYYVNNRSTIRSRYKKLSKVILDYNNPEKNPNAFLRKPQYEALEMYVFLKEGLGQGQMHAIFDDWLNKREPFENRSENAVEQDSLFGSINPADYARALSRLKSHAQGYPNYIFALTMGVGKTLLMATCVFYEFCLANKHPDDKRFCHNALIFAPDTTVLQSLKEIESFDTARVLPKEQADWLNANLKMLFLTDPASSLNILHGDSFNLVVSNTQKIIVKKRAKQPGAASRLFSPEKVGSAVSQMRKLYADIYNQDEADIAEGDLNINQRFHMLCRLPQLGVYVDEAHHAFGSGLAKDMGVQKSDTSLRATINLLNKALSESKSRMVACFNFTGTPYVKDELLPEVVYSYGLKSAINARYLKTTEVKAYSKVKSKAFIKETVQHFWRKYGEKTYENMIPKLAFFAATIDELTTELRPTLESVLDELGIGIDRILVNVGEEKITTNDDLRDFNSLDSPDSTKQFILLVGKGKEGWNCRSLFGVAMFREPKSKIFVLQASLRCLRSIGDTQAEAAIYLSEENRAILDAELQQNFRLRTGDLFSGNDEKSSQIYQVRVLKDVSLNVTRTENLYKLVKNDWKQPLDLNVSDAPKERWKATVRTTKNLVSEKEAKAAKKFNEENLSTATSRYSRLTLCAEIARYLNASPIDIEDVLDNSDGGLQPILDLVNEFNDALHEFVIPNLFHALYDLKPYHSDTQETISLIKKPPNGFFEIHGRPELTRLLSEYQKTPLSTGNWAEKSFHLDTYCFDSKPELGFFDAHIDQTKIREIYFTGMFTHGQSDFYVSYIDPESNLLRHYYPDFLLCMDDDSWVMIEVKGENQIDNAVVQAKKDFASAFAGASKMSYHLIPSKIVDKPLVFQQPKYSHSQLPGLTDV